MVDTLTTIRDLEHASIRRFVESCSDHFKGRTLDYGAGDQPYREIVTKVHGQYHPWDRTSNPGSRARGDVGPELPLMEDWDAILSTQVIQYVPHVDEMLAAFCDALHVLDGHLVMTGPTNWPEVESEDLHRFTVAGITDLLDQTGFKVLRAESRASVEVTGETFSLGWGIVARPSW